ncbi:MAG: FAD-dependent oxidoreductase [Acidobacteriota bacterium]
MAEPIDVAIIGGGCAGLTTAWELSRPELGGRYRVTVYQQGWRLGGKGASSRGPNGRTEEHGLHVWMGTYENAFAMIRACYDELDRDPRTCPLADWRQVFVPAPWVGVMERATDAPWFGFFPPAEGLPGDGGHLLPDLRGYISRTVAMLATAMRSFDADDQVVVSSAEPAPTDLGSAVRRLGRLGGYASWTALAESASVLAASLAVIPVSGPMLAKAVTALAEPIRARLRQLSRQSSAARRLWAITDLLTAIIGGIARSGILLDRRGFDALNELDYREWLRRQGAAPSTLDSDFVRGGVYDLFFAYQGGDRARPALAAGVALRSNMRMFFTYRGSFFWKMTAGMGDAIFAPLYEVLARRGVRFRFFHRLRDVVLSAPEHGVRPHVEALDFDVQATPKGEYEPLIDVDGVPSWPDRPLWSQLRGTPTEGDIEAPWTPGVGTSRLEVGKDFDAVVLATGLGAVPWAANQLLERFDRWRAMVGRVETIATQAFQLWLREDPRALGWSGPPLATVAGFVDPFDTWSDMRQLLPRETFATPPGGLAFFTSVLPEPHGMVGNVRGAAERHRAVRDDAVAYLDQHAGTLWPGAVDATGGFDWDLLVPPDGVDAGRGSNRFDSQFWTANVRPSDRYVLSVPGSPSYRISPLDRDVDNLTVAGDWTACGIDTGSVESAVISGRLAAHAIAGSPALSDVVGWDHP